MSVLARARPALHALPAAVCFVAAFALTFARVVSERIYSDEQIFIGGAGLMARGEGLIYRDFFYTHMPTQALVMSLIYRATSHWALAARMFDALCGAALAAVLFEAARRAFAGVHAAWRTLLAASVAAIFIFNPVTADAVGKAWNHDLAALAGVLAVVLLAAGLARPRPTAWMIASGACAAIAVTTRLTAAPPMAALVLFFVVAPPHARHTRRRLLALWLAGGIVAALPAIVVCFASPANAWFENVRYPGLTARFATDLNLNARVTLPTKLAYVRRIVGRSASLELFAWTTLAAIALSLRPRRVRGSPVHARVAVAALLVAVASATMLVPTPIYHQYLYGPLPFAALAIAWGGAALGVHRRWWTRLALVGVAVACVHRGRASYHGVTKLATPRAWATSEWRRDAKRLARLVGREDADAKVLTFMPGLPLEAGLGIYPQLSIGRYAARSADYLTASERAQMNVPYLAAIERWFVDDPPAAVLIVDPTSPLEARIAAIAVEHGYVPQRFDEAWTLYLPPGWR